MTTFDFLFHLLELGAALVASFYWLKTKEKSIIPFVWYLWFIVFIETLALYPFLYEIKDNSIINSIKNSQFYRNTWLFNIYTPIVVFLIGRFMINNTNTILSHRIIKSLVFGFIIFWLFYFLFVANFFETVLPYHFIISTFVIFIMVMLYLRELLMSDELLNFYKSPVFFVIIALMLWYICLTPLFIFNTFYLKINEEFLTFRRIFLNTSNILLYSWYIFAFLYPLRFKKKLIPR